MKRKEKESKLVKKKNKNKTAKRNKQTKKNKDDSEEEDSEELDVIQFDDGSGHDELMDQLPPDSADAECIFCLSLFSMDKSGENWIKCLMCGLWAHYDCAGPEYDTWICDFCNSSRSSSRSRYSRAEQHAPAHAPHIVVTPMPRRSVFRDAAAVAGGVTVGTTMGHLAGEAISGLFTGRRREEVVHALPQNYQLGTEPSGPCAYEIAQFLQCATNHDNLQECAAFNEALRECKRRNRLP